VRLGRVKKTPEAGFDLTPMIDVLLLLIIFFVLSAQFAQAVRKAIPLPDEPGEKATEVGPQTLLIDVDREGALSAGGTAIDLEGLLVTLRSQVRQAGSPDKVEAVVRADRDAAAAHLNKVAKALSDTGIRNWKLATSGEGR
jgi:biopolymer transport protein ExbD